MLTKRDSEPSLVASAMYRYVSTCDFDLLHL